MTMVDPGAMNRRIAIEQLVGTQLPDGQPTETWEVLARVYASRLVGSGVSAIRAGADVSTVRASYRIRISAGITAGHRVNDRGELWLIDAVLPAPEEGRMDLVCRKLS